MGKRENYVDYVANRPGVKKLGEHGLWNAGGKVPVLQKAVDEVAHHLGNVWTPVIAIQRSDAERLGYIFRSTSQSIRSSPLKAA